MKLLLCLLSIAAASAGDHSDRIRRIESSLGPGVLIQGEPVPKWNLAERMRLHKVPAISVAVMQGGDIVWARAYGVLEAGSETPATPETRFQAASISKPVAATAALALVQSGRLSLDEDVNLKLKSWKVPQSELLKARKVTLRGLLNHSAGLTVHGFPGYASSDALPTLVDILNGSKPANTAAIIVDIEPGSRWRYSGGGYTVMQQLVIDVTGEPFPEFARKAVLEKAGMRHSTYHLPDAWRASATSGHNSAGEVIKGKWHTYPELAAAGLWTTPSDLLRWAAEIYRSYHGKSEQLLSRETTRQMLTRQLGDYGLGAGLEGEGPALRFGHGGSNAGFKCMLTTYAETGDGIAVMTNGDRGNAVAGELMRAVAAEYGWRDLGPKERTAVKLDPKVLAAYTGKYRLNPKMSITFTVKDGHLHAEPEGYPDVEFYAESELKFFPTESGVPSAAFIKDEGGRVIAVQLGNQKAPRIE